MIPAQRESFLLYTTTAMQHRSPESRNHRDPISAPDSDLGPPHSARLPLRLFKLKRQTQYERSRHASRCETLGGVDSTITHLFLYCPLRVFSIIHYILYISWHRQCTQKRLSSSTFSLPFRRLSTSTSCLNLVAANAPSPYAKVLVNARQQSSVNGLDDSLELGPICKWHPSQREWLLYTGCRPFWNSGIQESIVAHNGEERYKSCSTYTYLFATYQGV